MNKVFAQYLNEEEITGLSRAVHFAYRAVDTIYKTYPLLGNFLPGQDLRSHLINAAVQFELCKIAIPGFTTKIEKNAAKNCNHAVLLKDNLKITAHYLGSKKQRKMARPAIYRSLYAAVNADIFSDFGTAADDSKDVPKELYCHLYHSGVKKPDFVALSAPNDNQLGIIGVPLILPIIQTEEIQKTEEITDTIEHTLKAGVQDNEHQQQFKESYG